ncbi:MlaD family protein [Mycolicibacterium septicum]|uniref:MlaD family protein n=1 Tax=Mycolicibacterium septicum TaxID=98668 RepID=UPI002360945A|nr:MlaD family protein [Mycolicibacterium septicum]
MMKPAAVLWRLGIVGVVALLLFILLANVITNPVAPAVRTYAAEFTDASGLYSGADVRVSGVRVGKVQSVDIKRRKGQSVAAVGFTLDRRYGVVPATRLAIKYQSLTGSRYVDVVNASEHYTDAELITQVSPAMTQPSFDITALFNGLQPVIATLNPEELNTFTTNAVSLLSGDGNGFAAMLDSIHTLTKYVSNRQQVVATLMHNLSTVADAMGGLSPKMIQLLDWVNRPLDGALEVIDEFRKTELFSVGFLDPTVQLVTNLGFPIIGNSGLQFLHEGPKAVEQNVSNIDYAMDRAITNLDDFVQSIKLVPVMWDNVGPPSQGNTPVACSHGHFQLPEQMDVLLNGQRVVLCNR